MRTFRIRAVKFKPMVIMTHFAYQFQKATLVVKLKSFIILELDGIEWMNSIAIKDHIAMDHIIDDDSGDD